MLNFLIKIFIQNMHAVYMYFFPILREDIRFSSREIGKGYIKNKCDENYKTLKTSQYACICDAFYQREIIYK